MDDIKNPEVRRLVEEARRAYEVLGAAMRSRWDRDLPIEELIHDRWERARKLGFEEGASIYHNSYVYGRVAVGAGTWIGPMTILDGTGGLTIGAHCSISSGVQIYTHDTVKWALSGGVAEYERAPVAIGDSSHIGAQTVIARGVTIGDHCVIGACSFVDRDIPPFTVAFGVPCRPQGRISIGSDGSVKIAIEKKGAP
jgi:acetyltransferase-like isoleucine patch superfamily enzyme